MTDQFYVKLTGKLAEGRAPDMAAQFLSDTFHIPAETARTYFNGSPTVLKKKLDRATAEKVMHRLRNTGAACELEAAEDFGLTLELLDDAPAPAPAAPGVTEEKADAEDDGLSLELELLDVPAAAEAPQPLSVDDLQFEADAPDADEFSLEMVEQPEAAATLPLDTESSAPAAEPLDLSEPATAPQPPPLPEATLDAPPPSPEPTDDDPDDKSKGEEVDIGDVAPEAGTGGGVGGMLPQASAGPSFRRPNQAQDGLVGGSKKWLPVAAAAGLLLLVGLVYVLMFSDPAPPPVALVKKAPPKKVPEAVVDDSMFRGFQLDEVRVKLDSLAESIATWQLQFAAEADQASTPEEVKRSLKTDMGIAEADWLDPWDSVIQYQASGSGFSLISAGPDKQPGTADDITRDQTK
jgi:hypothetical protein